MIVNKKKKAEQRLNIKGNEKKRQILRSIQRTKKAMEHESDGDINCNWCTRNDNERHNKMAREVRNRRTSGEKNYSFISRLMLKTYQKIVSNSKSEK